MNRRHALQCLTTAGILSENKLAGQAPDQPRRLSPAKADTGSLFPVIESMAARREYTHSFLGTRFSSLEDYRIEGRKVTLEALGPRPDPVDPSPEIVDRRQMDWGTLEKVLFSTTRDSRIPAYVLVPKRLRGPGPAIVDLHSHGGMFIFGK